jgi:hypothetical protein
MPRTGTFLEAAVSFYSNLAFGGLAAMRQTQEEVRTEQFEVSRALSRTISFWLDATEGWFNALLVTASEPLPTVFLRVGENTGTDTREVRVLVPAKPEFTGAVHVGGGTTLKGVDVRSTKDKDGLSVKIKNVNEKRQPGLYMGLVHIGVKPLAIVMVSVTDDNLSRGRSVSEVPELRPG